MVLDSEDPLPQSAGDLPQHGMSPALAAAERTAWRLANIEFAWDINKALEFALLQTYAVPEIAGLLARTGEFSARTLKRYDDTALLIRAALCRGLGSESATRAFARINAMHGRYRIAHEDFRYVLATFMFTPVEWIAERGRRPLTAAEEEDWFQFWREFGQRMQIADLPETRAAFRAFARDYEARRFAFSPANAAIATATVDLLLAMHFVPRPLLPAGRAVVMAMCPPALVAALGFGEPPRLLRRAVAAAFRLRRFVLSRLPDNGKVKLLRFGDRTYREGWRIEELGTFPRDRR